MAHSYTQVTDTTSSSLAEVRQLARLHAQPMILEGYDCTVMILGNLAQLEWLPIPCDQPYLKTVVCESTAEPSVPPPVYFLARCLEGYVPLSTICLSVSYSGTNFGQLLSQDSFQTINNTENRVDGLFQNVSLLLEDQLDRFWPLEREVHLLWNRNGQTFAVTLQKILDMFLDGFWVRRLFASTRTAGRMVFDMKLKLTNKRYSLKGQRFVCNNLEIIRTIWMCDGKHDCEHGEDEQYCDCDSAEVSNQKELFLFKCTVQTNIPPRLCQKPCLRYFTNPVQLAENKWSCSSGKEILKRYLNDSVPDCPEQDDENRMKLSIMRNLGCADKSQIQCFSDSEICFSFHKLCIYEVDAFGNLFTCRNGFHLSECKEAQCNNKHKCFNSYCIPNSYVCNGKWDCKHGEDENNCQASNCFHWFKCKETSICLPVEHICDHIIDCPMHDDELLCNVSCPHNCTCYNLAAVCQVSLGTFLSKFHSFLFMHFQWSLVSKLLVASCTHASHIIISNSNLDLLCFEVSDLLSVVAYLNLNDNKLVSVSPKCFDSFAMLRYLNLSSMQTEHVQSCSFQTQEQLETLDLSRNRISQMKKSTFCGLKNITMIFLEHNPIQCVETNVFHLMTTLKAINTTYFAVCCPLQPQVLCTSKPEWPTSCSDILKSRKMKSGLLSANVLIYIFNTLSLLLIPIRKVVLTEKRVSPYRTSVVFINITDVLCSLYLTVILAVDSKTSGIFFTTEKVWRSSILCHTIAIVFSLFSIVSPVMLSFWTLLRYLVVKRPFSARDQSKVVVVKWAFFSFAVSLVVVIPMWTVKYFGENQKCMGLPLCTFAGDTERSIAANIFTGFLSFWLLSATFVINSIYILLLCELRKEGCEQKSHISPSTAVQVVVITTSNVLCWIPVSVIYILSLVWEKYPVNVMGWNTIAVMPINSAVNPFVFVISEMKNIYKERKKPGVTQSPWKQ